MKTTKTLLVVITVLVLAAMACGGGGGATAPTKEAAPASGGGSSSTAPTKEAAPASGGNEQDLNMSSVTEGLTNLKSYKAKMLIKFVGKDDQGQPVDGSMDLYEEFINEPRAQRMSATTSGISQAQAGTFEMVTIGETSYIILVDQEGKKSCISSSSADNTPEQGLFSPDTLGGISSAKFVKAETVNGVNTKHYTWKEGGILGMGFTSGKGDVWVAVDGGYAVKYTAEATGKGALFGAGSQGEGTVTVEYNLTEVNGSFKIEAPTECESPASDVPTMADAKDKSSFGGIVTYVSASPFADVVEFYKEEMPKNGWEPGEDATEMEGLAMLNYTKDNRKAQLMISEDKDKQVVNVMITITEE